MWCPSAAKTVTVGSSAPTAKHCTCTSACSHINYCPCDFEGHYMVDFRIGTIQSELFVKNFSSNFLKRKVFHYCKHFSGSQQVGEVTCNYDRVRNSAARYSCSVVLCLYSWRRGCGKFISWLWELPHGKLSVTQISGWRFWENLQLESFGTEVVTSSRG